MFYKLSTIAIRRFSTNRIPNFYKVGVIGACGGIGQPLSLLLKSSPLVTELALHDIVHIPGVAADLSHINTPAKVVHYQGLEQLKKCVQGCKLVICPAGQPRKPGMTRDDLFGSNAKAVKDTATATADAAPDAPLLIITNPINSVIPIACGIYRYKKKNEMNVFGISSLDLVRASTFVASLKNLDPTKLWIPVVGGHAGKTIVPLLSQSNPKVSLTDKEVDGLTSKIQEAGTEVVKAKAGGGSATLSVAYAAFNTVEKFLKAFGGNTNQVECCYVRQDFGGIKYFSTPLQLGPKGFSKNLGMPSNISEYEKKAIDGAISELKKAIKKGEEYNIKD